MFENESFDCKSSPYQLDGNSQRFEMAKDVCAFANVDGGIILIGARTRRNDLHSEDEIESINPFPRDLVNIDRCLSIIDAQIFPRIDRIEVRWFPSTIDANRGLVAFIVPKQLEEPKPFLLTKPIEGNTQIPGFIFGYVERRRAGTSHSTIQQFHSQFKLGRHSDVILQANQEVQETLARLIERLEHAGSTHPQGEIIEAELDGRITGAINAAELNGQPLVAIAATPYRRFEVVGLFESRKSEIVRLLETPPEIRPHGFDISVGTNSRIIRGQMRRAVIPGVRLLELWRDGTLIFIEESGGICWGMGNQPSRPLRINPLALVEKTYVFSELYRQILGSVGREQSELHFIFRIQNFTVADQPSRLAPGPLHLLAQRVGPTRPAPNSNFESRYRANTFAIHPGAVAYNLVREVYFWFGYDIDDIPYLEERDGTRLVSADQICNARA